MNKHYIKIKDKFNDDYLSLTPKVFNNRNDGYCKFCLSDVYGSLFYMDKLDEKPIYYFRHSNPNSYRFGGFIELGDKPLNYQKGGYHIDDVANKDTPVNGYRLVNSNPIEYGFDSECPYSKYRFFNNRLEIEETDIFKGTAKPLGPLIIDHSCIFSPLSQISRPCLFEGLYEKKKVIGIGSYDCYYMPKEIKKDIGDDLGYFCFSGQGIREDGRYEIVIISINHNGVMCGMYYLEGEKPIIDYKVKLETKFKKLPYVNDGTCIYTKAKYSFGGINVYFDGRWGSKGFSKNPRIERHGQSQCFGDWWINEKPYKHTAANSFVENMNCYEDVLRKIGYEVSDE